MSLYVDIEKRLGDFRLRARFETQGGTLGLLGASCFVMSFSFF